MLLGTNLFGKPYTSTFIGSIHWRGLWEWAFRYWEVLREIPLPYNLQGGSRFAILVAWLHKPYLITWKLYFTWESWDKDEKWLSKGAWMSKTHRWGVIPKDRYQAAYQGGRLRPLCCVNTTYGFTPLGCVRWTSTWHHLFFVHACAFHDWTLILLSLKFMISSHSGHTVGIYFSRHRQPIYFDLTWFCSLSLFLNANMGFITYIRFCQTAPLHEI